MRAPAYACEHAGALGRPGRGVGRADVPRRRAHEPRLGGLGGLVRSCRVPARQTPSPALLRLRLPARGRRRRGGCLALGWRRLLDRHLKSGALVAVGEPHGAVLARGEHERGTTRFKRAQHVVEDHVVARRVLGKRRVDMLNQRALRLDAGGEPERRRTQQRPVRKGAPKGLGLAAAARGRCPMASSLSAVHETLDDSDIDDTGGLAAAARGRCPMAQVRMRRPNTRVSSSRAACGRSDDVAAKHRSRQHRRAVRVPSAWCRAPSTGGWERRRRPSGAPSAAPLTAETFLSPTRGRQA